MQEAIYDWLLLFSLSQKENPVLKGVVDYRIKKYGFLPISRVFHIAPYLPYIELELRALLNKYQARRYLVHIRCAKEEDAKLFTAFYDAHLEAMVGKLEEALNRAERAIFELPERLRYASYSFRGFNTYLNLLEPILRVRGRRDLLEKVAELKQKQGKLMVVLTTSKE